MARQTIYIPENLKERMDAYKDEANWSAIACKAFAVEISNISQRSRGDDMQATIDRLRADKAIHESEMYQCGVRLGRSWAQLGVTYSQLERIAECEDSFETDEQSAYSPGEVFFFYIEPAEAGDRHAAQQFWENVLDPEQMHRLRNADFVDGFAESASQLFNEVYDKI